VYLASYPFHRGSMLACGFAADDASGCSHENKVIHWKCPDFEVDLLVWYVACRDDDGQDCDWLNDLFS